MQKLINITTDRKEKLYDITDQVVQYVKEAKIQTGLINMYVRGATAAIMIQENWDESVQQDAINLFQKLIPEGIWKHDKLDNNGAAHLKSGIIGPSETIPIIDGKLGLSTWQNIFLCEFNGPRSNREVVLTVIKS